jgi:hypothetical protein
MRKKEMDYTSSHIYPTCTANEEKRKYSPFLSSSFAVQVGFI